MLQNRLFFALASRSGFEATNSDAVARSSIVFCNSVSADRIGMAASRLLLALAASDFPFKNPLKKCFKIAYAVRNVFCSWIS